MTSTLSSVTNQQHIWSFCAKKSPNFQHFFAWLFNKSTRITGKKHFPHKLCRGLVALALKTHAQPLIIQLSETLRHNNCDKIRSQFTRHSWPGPLSYLAILVSNNLIDKYLHIEAKVIHLPVWNPFLVITKEIYYAKCTLKDLPHNLLRFMR